MYSIKHTDTPTPTCTCTLSYPKQMHIVLDATNLLSSPSPCVKFCYVQKISTAYLKLELLCSFWLLRMKYDGSRCCCVCI